ncbi:MAG TPA: ABC transporter transmembrane domain-containing protein [Anaerolineales bacterium]|nr:ABC transporter transmembrane domain-containing protein [Anaerolineales bacterium]
MSEELLELEEEEYTSQFTMPVFKRIAGHLIPHWRWVLAFFIAIAATSVTDAYFTYLNKEIVDVGIRLEDTAALQRIAWLYGGVILFQVVSVFVFIYLASLLGERVQYDLRRMLFERLQQLSLSYYSQNSVGRLIARVTSDTGRVSDLVSWGVVDTTWATMNIITSLVFMAIINWKLALIVCAILPVMIFAAVKFRQLILVEYRVSRRTNSKITGAYNENFQGVRVVKALLREDENTKEFQELTTAMYRASYRAAWLSALFLPVVQIAWLYCGLWRTADRDRRNDHRRDSSLRIVSHVHDVARAGLGARLCRDAAFHRFGGTHLQVGRHPARSPRPRRGCRRRDVVGRDRVRPCGFLL